MIQANELRIGNWVLAPEGVVYNSSDTDDFNKLTYYQINFISDNGGILQIFEPIPLTPETISKCISLKLAHSNDWWDCYQSEHGWYVSYTKHTEPSAGVEAGNFYHSDGFYPVKYVHDLQNLHYYTSYKRELQFIW